MRNLSYIVLLGILCLNSTVNAQIFNKEVEAKIDIGFKGVLTQITFSAYNKTSLKKSLRYRALIVKGASNTTTKGENFEDEQFFIIEPGERKNISTATLDLEGNQRTIILHWSLP